MNFLHISQTTKKMKKTKKSTTTGFVVVTRWKRFLELKAPFLEKFLCCRTMPAIAAPTKKIPYVKLVTGKITDGLES